MHSATPDWQMVHAVADSYLSRFATAIEAGIVATREKIPHEAIAEAVAFGDMDKVFSLIPWDMGLATGLPTVYTPIFKQAPEPVQGIVMDVMGDAQAVASLPLGFDLVDPDMVDHAYRFTAELVVGIARSTRDSIRAAITHGIIAGVPPRSTARTIEQSIGLLPSQARAVANYRESLERLAQGIGTPNEILGRYKLHPRNMPLRNLDAARIDAYTERYAARQLRHRATMIARTETMAASNMGIRNGWMAAVNDGRLPADMELVWITTPDDRLCPTCAPMDGQVVGIRNNFDSTEKQTSKGLVPTTWRSLPTPPLHPMCRCTIGVHEGKADAPKLPELSHPPPLLFQGPTVKRTASNPNKAAAQRWLDSLSQDERDALFTYTGSGFRSMNMKLRGLPDKEINTGVSIGTGPKLDKLIADMQAALAKAPQGDPLLVYRGFRAPTGGKRQMLESFEPGKTVRLEGFQSTSVDPSEAANRSNIVFEIQTKSGAFVDDVSRFKGEEELILDHNKEYRVIDVFEEVPYSSRDGNYTGTIGHLIQLEEL